MSGQPVDTPTSYEEQYYRLGDEMPMGLKLASLEQLKSLGLASCGLMVEQACLGVTSRWSMVEKDL